MESIVILPFTLFCIHAILLQMANCQALSKEVEEAAFKTLCSTKCQDFEKSNETQDFPLYACSCSPSCVTFGDCCYDSPYRNETIWERRDSICLSVSGRGQYRAISGCPADQVSDFCHDGIGHLPPVTSKKTNTTYANIFCATCNGDGDRVTTWKVDLRCSSDNKDDIEAEDSTNDDSTTLVYHSNQIWRLSKSTNTKNLCIYHVHFDNFTLIDGLELRNCDEEKMVSDCSSSWRDAGIMKLCRSYVDPIYFGSKLFRNLHCAQCNYMDPEFGQCIPFSIEVMQKMGLLDPSVIQFCQNRGFRTCIESLSRGRPYPFSQLLNIHTVECVSDNENRRCCPGQKYDFMSKRCRKVLKRD